MATSSISNVFEISTARRDILARANEASNRESVARERVIETAFVYEREDDGLGCIRGFAIATVLNMVLMIAGFVGWELWKHLR